MENELVERLGGMGLETQIQMFQTAYSKVGFSLRPHTHTEAQSLIL